MNDMYFQIASIVSASIRLPTAVTLLLACAIGTSQADVIWSGDYLPGNFSQWHNATDSKVVTFHQIPTYGRPRQHGLQAPEHVGNGELLSLVADTERTVDGIYYPKGPTRGKSQYAAKFTVKNSANDREPDDCDNGLCDRRRTELTVQQTLPKFYNAIPNLSERWLSISVFVPTDWSDAGSGWGPLVYQVKPIVDGGGVGPTIHLRIEGGQWYVRHTWTDVPNCQCNIPWQQQMDYSSTGTAAALLDDFPNQAASRAALTLTKGIWVDWIMHVKFDSRGVSKGGSGFLNVWNRHGNGNWTHLLHVKPKSISIGGMTFDRGIGQNAPATGGSPSGFGIKAGLYMDTGQISGTSGNRVIYNANIKVGDANATFAEMSPDGSSPDSTFDELESPPRPPLINN